jgi:hypothetical protein
VSSNTRLATFHHLIKTHKPGPHLRIRPIVASRGSPTEKISWLLSALLSPLLKTVPAHIPDSSHLMTAVTGTAPEVLQQHPFQASLDVVALYTSVPVEEALGAVRDKLLREAVVPSPLETEDVVTLLRAVFNLTFFSFEGEIFRQRTGLPMGCAVSGITAILFLERIEERALALFARCPLFVRYVDDCYALVRNEDDARQLLAIFNDQHPSIKFELEMCARENNATSLSLLDLTVRLREDGEATFDFYTKEAKKEIFVHRQSALPWSQKTAAIRNEIKRIETRSDANRSSNKAAFEAKLRSNGYNEDDIRSCSRASRGGRSSGRERGPAYYINLPFFGENAERRIRRAFTKEGINIRITRRATTILDIVRPRQPDTRVCRWDLCPTKDAGTCFVKNCVYEITCQPCGRRYVGSTIRPMHERIREHTRSGRGSTIHQHLLACGNGAARTNVRILARERDEVNARIREAIAIKKICPELNTQEEIDLANIVL